MVAYSTSPRFLAHAKSRLTCFVGPMSVRRPDSTMLGRSRSTPPRRKIADARPHAALKRHIASKSARGVSPSRAEHVACWLRATYMARSTSCCAGAPSGLGGVEYAGEAPQNEEDPDTDLDGAVEVAGSRRVALGDRERASDAGVPRHVLCVRRRILLPTVVVSAGRWVGYRPQLT